MPKKTVKLDPPTWSPIASQPSPEPVSHDDPEYLPSDMSMSEAAEDACDITAERERLILNSLITKVVLTHHMVKY